MGEGLDLHAALIPNPVCTFYMRASGNGMRQHGINDCDLMVIDRSVEPCSGHVVVVAHQGSFLMRPLLRQRGQWLLDLEAFDRSGLFGVVVQAVHRLNKPLGRQLHHRAGKQV